ncbi:MAG: MBL fold metallo-hydrolase [Nitrospinaceae bacterium]|nr:MAG: MBL fold metallo-hydrolase [Nitrospinaceae bacterium]
MPTLKFLGAIQQVTGSCYLVETTQGKILLDCGMYQGEMRLEKIPEKHFGFDPKSIDAVILSHAHLDHSGLLPRLTREGYRGPVFVTEPTRDLLGVMLKDAAFIQGKDIEWENKWRRRAGKELIEPLYDIKDVEKVLGLLTAVGYNQRTPVISGVEVRFRDAGHIIGSAIVELWVNENGNSKKIVFSGDLGNHSSPLLHDPEIIETADILLMESTYGDRDHKNADKTLEEFKQVLNAAIEDGGNIFIPSFAVGRTQDLLYHLGRFYREGALKQQKVFLDSPMATNVSEIYARHSALYNEEDPEFNKAILIGWENWLPILTYTCTTKESMALNNIKGGAIIIAGSGMCTGGRIRHHFKHNLWRSKSHIIFVGFQARGTLGRTLVDGAKQVKFMGQEFAVKAKVHTLGGFSAHAGQSQLLDWAGRFQEKRPHLYLVHGELNKMLVLQNKFHEKYNWYANIPAPGETIAF